MNRTDHDIHVGHIESLVALGKAIREDPVLSQFTGTTDQWRQRALAAEAQVRALKEAQGELLELVDYLRRRDGLWPYAAPAEVEW